MSNQLLTTINTRIATIAGSEKITKKELGLVSREVLQYTLAEWDAQVINRLTAVLTPMNKKTAVLFFRAHTPFKFDETTKSFGGIKDKKAKAECQEKIAIFLESSETIWEWFTREVTIERKQPNFVKNIASNTKKAIEAGQDKTDLIGALFEGGVTEEDVMAVLANMQAPAKAA